MANSVLRVALATALLLQPAVSWAATNPRSDIDAANQRFITALKNSDWTAIAGDYEETGEFISVHADVVGRKNLEKLFANRTSPGKFDSGSCRSTHLAVAKDRAIEQGSCSLKFTVNGQHKASTGHYVTVWKYHPERARWLIHTNVVLD
jgi:ketosteroid isomerase-like protein